MTQTLKDNLVDAFVAASENLAGQPSNEVIDAAIQFLAIVTMAQLKRKGLPLAARCVAAKAVQQSVHRVVARALGNGGRRPYRVNKSRKRESKPKSNGLGLNAIGKPYSPSYDPKWRMHHSVKVAKGGPGPGLGVTPEQWTQMCAIAKQQWEHSLRTGEPLPINMGRWTARTEVSQGVSVLSPT